MVINKLTKNKTTVLVLTAAILLGIIFWIVDGVLSFYFFRESLRFMVFQRPETLLESVATNISSYTLFVRVSFLVACAIGGILTAIFINRQKKAEEALRESVEKFRDLANHVPVGVIQTSARTGESFFVNDAALRLFEFDSEEEFFAQGSPTRWKHLEERERLVQLLREQGEVRDFEAVVLTKTDRDKSVILSSKADGDTLLSTVLDITERKQAEQALLESEERFRRALENIPDVIVIYDADLRIRYINAATHRITGRPESDFIGKREEEIWPPEVYQAYLPTLQEAFNTGAIRSVETNLSLPNGGVFNLRITCVPLSDEKGQIREVLGITHDFTERKRSEEALRKSEIRFRTLVERLPAITYIAALDESSTTLYVSPQIEKMLGISPEEYKADPDFWATHLHDKDRERVLEEVSRAHETGQPFVSEYRMISTDGQMVWVGDEAVIVKDEKGNPLYLQGVMLDITERVRAQESLREERDRAQRYLDLAGVMFVVVDADRSVSLINRRGCDILGREVEEIVGKNWFDTCVPERLRDEVKAIFDRLMDGEVEPVEYYENPVVTKGGEERIIAWHNTLLTDDIGNTIGTLSSGEDITVRKRAEEELREYRERLEELVEQRTAELNERVAEVEQLNLGMVNLTEDLQAANRSLEATAVELQEVNQELDDFAYIVSHDLKAPLRGITQLAHWISTDYADALDVDGQEMLDLLMGRTRRMHNLIDGILQYSRVGRISEEVSSVNLNQLVQETIEMLAPPEHIQITVESELPTVVGERTRLGQVFQNLLSNAIKFMDKPEGRVSIGCVDEGTRWRFSVTDNGPGIEEKYYDKVFQIFQTLSPRDEFESTGAGLSLVKKIVETWGGRIWVESTVGQGSTFYFTLPKAD